MLKLSRSVARAITATLFASFSDTASVATLIAFFAATATCFRSQTGSSCLISTPSKVTRPTFTSYNLSSNATKVLLPLPLAPTTYAPPKAKRHEVPRHYMLK